VTTTAPVLFLPGTLCDERVWLPVWQRMKIAQRRYVPLQWAATKDDMLALTSDRILDGEKVHLVGYSMGGYIACLWASLYPHHLASITLIGYNAKGLSSKEVSRRNQLVTLLKSGQFNPSNPAYVSRFVHPSHHSNEGVVGVIRDMADDLGKTTLLAHTQVTTPREDLVPSLAKMGVPIHIIAAADDEVAPLSGLRNMADTLKSSLNVVENAGHMLPLEQPDKLATLLSSCING